MKEVGLCGISNCWIQLFLPSLLLLSTCGYGVLTNDGTEFVFGYPPADAYVSAVNHLSLATVHGYPTRVQVFQVDTQMNKLKDEVVSAVTGAEWIIKSNDRIPAPEWGSWNSLLVLANDKISLLVWHCQDDNNRGGLFLPLPSHSWGTDYIVNTRHDAPSFLMITASQLTNVRVDVRVTGSDDPQTWKPLKDGIVGLDKSAHVTINKHRSHLVRTSTNLGLGGTLVRADRPVGVICGNVLPSPVNELPDYTIEPMIPIQYAGRAFVLTPSPTYPRGRRELIIIRAVTNSRFHVDTGRGLVVMRGIKYPVLSYTTNHSSLDCCEIEASAINRVHSEKNLQILHFLNSPDSAQREGSFGRGPAMANILPTNMWKNFYITRLPSVLKSVFFQAVAAKPFGYLGTPKNVFSFPVAFTSLANRSVVISEWQELSVSQTKLYVLRSVNCHDTFALYLIAGAAPSRGDYSPLGMTFATWPEVCGTGDNPDEQRVCGHDPTAVSKAVCAEMKNPGAWTNWGPWDNCDMMRCIKIRNRTCSNPAPGPFGQRCPGSNSFSQKQKETMASCKGKMCPADCQNGTYSTECLKCQTNDCSSCDKYSGQCTDCKLGFRLTETATCEACPAGKYGTNCEQSCPSTCHNCNPETGICNERLRSDTSDYGILRDGSSSSEDSSLAIMLYFALALGGVATLAVFLFNNKLTQSPNSGNGSISSEGA